jgi:glutathione synthase/RimK-type ligase-like ATP-grasp enzyme
MGAGFNVPDTLVTTDPRDVRAFCAEHDQVVYKSTSGVRSIVNLLKASDVSRLDDVRACPTQFQQHIAGIDHRVHVVGGELFAARIESGAIDYRYTTPVRYAPAGHRQQMSCAHNDPCTRTGWY